MGSLPPLDNDRTTETPRTRGGIGRLFSMLLIPAIVGGLVAFGVTRLTDDDGGAANTVTVTTDRGDSADRDGGPEPAPLAPTGGLTVRDIVDHASPGVVRVAHRGGLGTGFLVDEDGHILTNAHVVDSAKTVEVTYQDGNVSQAKVLASDPNIDLAVLEADRPPQSAKVLQLGRSGEVRVGESVVAIGNPLNYTNSVTTGIVSGLKRQICSPNESPIGNAIQTDAAITHGNSGGPLLDSRARVIGINSQIVSRSGGNEGIGFAVPIDTVRPIMETVIAGGKPAHAWIGILGEPVTPPVAKELGIPGRTGVAIRTVDPRGPAKAGGLRGSSAANDKAPKGGDVIVKVAGHEVRDFGDLLQQVSSRKVGEKLEITYLRDGDESTTEITLADRPKDLNRGSSQCP